MDKKMIQIFTVCQGYNLDSKIQMKVKGWGKVFHPNSNQNKHDVALILSDKINFKRKIITRDKKVM